MWRCISPGVRPLSASLLQVPPILFQLESSVWSFEAVETDAAGLLLYRCLQWE